MTLVPSSHQPPPWSHLINWAEVKACEDFRHQWVPPKEAKEDLSDCSLHIALHFKNLSIASFQAPADAGPPCPSELEQALHEAFSGNRATARAHNHRRGSSSGCRKTRQKRKVGNLTAKSCNDPSPTPAVAWSPNPNDKMTLSTPITQQVVGLQSTPAVLLDRPGMCCALFPKPLSQIGRSFWSAVEKIYVHVPQQLDWTKLSSISSRLVVGQLFAKSQTVMIPLRDLDRVEHAWELLSLSKEAEVVRLREQLEETVAAIHGPAGCRAFPYRKKAEYSWVKSKTRFMLAWLYMRYLGQNLGVSFRDLWVESLVYGKSVLKPNHEWLIEELRKMPKIEEVMFIARPGFSPSAGTFRSDPSILLLKDDRTRVPMSPAPCHVQCSEWDTYIKVPEDGPVPPITDLRNYPFITYRVDIC